MVNEIQGFCFVLHIFSMMSYDAMLTHDWGITGENHVKVSGRPRNSICFLPLCLMPGSAVACVISIIEDGVQLE